MKWPNPQRFRLTSLLLTISAGVAFLFGGCNSTPPSESTLPVPQPGPQPTPAAVTPVVPGTVSSSQAKTPREYRKDAASHLYGKNQDRIYHGKMPPLLYAIGVLQVEVDAKGSVSGIKWMRAPKHAPEVIAEIERTVRAAAPYPMPVRLGRVTYTDTWLWHRTGTFQLDTLTEGQY